MRFCDVCRFEEPSHAPWCSAGRKPRAPDEDHIKKRFHDLAVKCWKKEMEALRKENAKLRALVERGANLSEGITIEQDDFVCECGEALK